MPCTLQGAECTCQAARCTGYAQACSWQRAPPHTALYGPGMSFLLVISLVHTYFREATHLILHVFFYISAHNNATHHVLVNCSACPRNYVCAQQCKLFNIVQRRCLI